MYISLNIYTQYRKKRSRYNKVDEKGRQDLTLTSGETSMFLVPCLIRPVSERVSDADVHEFDPDLWSWRPREMWYGATEEQKPEVNNKRKQD